MKKQKKESTNQWLTQQTMHMNTHANDANERTRGAVKLGSERGKEETLEKRAGKHITFSSSASLASVQSVHKFTYITAVHEKNDIKI